MEMSEKKTIKLKPYITLEEEEKTKIKKPWRNNNKIANVKRGTSSSCKKTKEKKWLNMKIVILKKFF